MVMQRKTLFAIAVVVLTITTVACSLFDAEPTGTPPVVQLMPDLPGYRVIEGEAVQEYIVGLADGAALLSGNPQMIFLIEKIDRAIDCYQETGAVSVRIYSDEGFPLSSGAVAIADRNRLMDPATLFRCIGGRMVPFSAQPSLNPCTHSYTLERDDNEFYIVYVGTTQEICEAFCSDLEGCSLE